MILPSEFKTPATVEVKELYGIEIFVTGSGKVGFSGEPVVPGLVEFGDVGLLVLVFGLYKFE